MFSVHYLHFEYESLDKGQGLNLCLCCFNPCEDFTYCDRYMQTVTVLNPEHDQTRCLVTDVWSELATSEQNPPIKIKCLRLRQN